MLFLPHGLTKSTCHAKGVPVEVAVEAERLRFTVSSVLIWVVGMCKIIMGIGNKKLIQ